MSAGAGPAPLTVTQLTGNIRSLLEGEFSSVWVTGEVSNCNQNISGHWYFTLKDRDAQLSCVWFKGHAIFSPFKPANGMQVILFGDISVYEKRGQYQLVVRLVQGGGEGALHLQFEALKAKLKEEGLFDADRKQSLPLFPQTIAVVTSPTGAAIQDMLHVFEKRAPWLRILVYPVKVQGEGAAAEIAAALSALQESSGKTLPVIDVIIVARGGGSLEDLWSFNEEVVARAMARCEIPVVSGVGHETDFTIADFVADARAPTPTAAAALVAPDGETLRERLDTWQATLKRGVARQWERLSRDQELAAAQLQRLSPEPRLREWEQRMDDNQRQLVDTVKSRLQENESLLLDAAHRLRHVHPERLLEGALERVVERGRRLDTVFRGKWHEMRSSLENAASLLRTLGPAGTLARGFSLTKNKDGVLVTDATMIKRGEEVTTLFHKGSAVSRVEEISLDTGATVIPPRPGKNPPIEL